jgi:hypothetical protein
MATLQLIFLGNIPPVVTIIVGILIGILIFWLIREVWCWYLKINEITLNQDRIIYLLTKILVQQGGELNDEDKINMKY